MGIANRIAINAATRWVAQGVHGITGLLLVPFLLGQLGEAGYGVANVCLRIVGFSVLADLGLRGALGRQLAEQVTRKDDRRFNELASTALLLYLGISGLLALTCIITAPQLAHFFAGGGDKPIDPGLMRQAVFLIRWYAPFHLLVSFTNPVFVASINSNNRFDLANYALIVVNVARFGAMVLVLSLTGWGLYGWAAAMYFSEALLLVVYLCLAHRARPSLRLRPSLVNREAMKPLFGLGGYMFTLQLTESISVQSDPLVLSRLLGPASLAFYSPGLALTQVVQPIVGTLAHQMHPLTTSFHVTGQRERLQAVLIRGTRLTWLMGILSSTVLVVFAEPIIRFWIGNRLGPDYIWAVRVLQAWAVVDLLRFSGGTDWPVLLGMKRLGLLVKIQVPFSIINIVASILLVMYTNLGVVGVVIPTIVLVAISRPITLVYLTRLLKLPLGRYLMQAYLRPAIVLALLLVQAAALHYLLPPQHLLTLLGEAAVTGMVWVVLTWLIGLGDEDRQAIRRMLSGMGGRIRSSRSIPAEQPVGK